MGEITEPPQTLGARIRYVRKRLALTQEGFGEALATYRTREERRLVTVTRGAVANWERNKGIDRKNLGAISRRWSLSLDWLDSGSGPTPTHLRPETPPEAQQPRPVRNVPLLGSAEGRTLPNGTRGFELTDKPIAMLFRPPGRALDEDLYAVVVAGDSMQPGHPEGEIRFVSRTQRLEPGDTVLVHTRYWDGAPPQVQIKTFVREEPRARQLLLRQTNPETNIAIPNDYVEHVHRVLTTAELFGG